MSNIIVDFDGTIADSLPTLIERFYEWSGTKPFSDQEIEELRNLSVKEVLTAVKIPLWKLPSLLVMARKGFGQYMNSIPVFSGMPEALEQLHKNGHKIYLISSNSSENIKNYLKLHKINGSFDYVHGNMGLFGKSVAMKSIMKKNKKAAGKWYAIGDETRDIEAAKKANVISVAVTWGFNGQQILTEHKPDFLASKPAELLKLIQ